MISYYLKRLRLEALVMMSTLKKLHLTSFATALVLSMFSLHVLAVPTSSDFATAPPAISSSSSTKPLAMLVMSNDHQLFYKAYNDWSDLDGDGQIESTYKHSFDYYGYFDSYKCYEYDTTDLRLNQKQLPQINIVLAEAMVSGVVTF